MRQLHSSLAALVLAMATHGAFADVTYNVTVGNYTDIDAGTLYTTSMHFSGWFSTTQALPANLWHADIGPNGLNLMSSWSFSDGVHTFIPANSVPDLNITPGGYITTDASGQIVDGAMYMVSMVPHAVGATVYGFEFEGNASPQLQVFTGICGQVDLQGYCMDGTLIAAASYDGDDVSVTIANGTPTDPGTPTNPGSGNANYGVIGTPVEDSVVSGVGVISGYHCSSKDIDIYIDDVWLGKAGAGTTLKGTQEVCGRTDTGYSLLYAFNNLGNGRHQVRAYAGGVLFDSQYFTSFRSGGVPWLSGVTRTVIVPDFPSPGQNAKLEWVQSYQNFLITDIQGQ
jgi:hypothetical protein